MKLIGTALKAGRVTFVSSQSELHVSNNRLYRIALSAPVKDKLRNIAAGAGGAIPLENLYQRSFISDNEFLGTDNEFAMEHVSMNADSFEREAGDAGNVIARFAIYVGNFSTDDIRLFNASVVNQKAANLNINIVDM